MTPWSCHSAGLGGYEQSGMWGSRSAVSEGEPSGSRYLSADSWLIKQLINRLALSQPASRHEVGFQHLSHWRGVIGGYKSDDRTSVSLTNMFSLSVPLCSVAELWPAAVCEEQRGRARVIQFERCPRGFPPSDRRGEKMASAAAAGLRQQTFLFPCYVNVIKLKLLGSRSSRTETNK